MPLFGAEELEAIQRPLETGWVVQGPFVSEFEEKFRSFTGADHAVATSSCTTALHIAVAALGLKPGDQVIVPGFTWVSTANVVEYMGATPVFCDIDLQTFNIDPAALEAAITPRTVGVLPVHLFGLCADMGAVLDIAGRRDLWIVEDGACALGGWYEGRHAGTFGDMGCFSFHPRKSITTGEGGMITTGEERFDSLARSLRDHGATRSDLVRHTERGSFLLSEYPHLGYNYRMTDIQGALGSAQMDRAEAILGGRSRCARLYDEALEDVSWLQTPAIPDGYIHGYQAYVCLFAPEEPTMGNVARLHEQRNELMMRLEERGIATRQGTHSAVETAYYTEKYGLRPKDFPNSSLADRLTLALPLYPQMTEADQTRVVTELGAVWETL
jgi:dTDP-4-amino-4,6-dideoxygalactose transaminase